MSPFVLNKDINPRCQKLGKRLSLQLHANPLSHNHLIKAFTTNHLHCFQHVNPHGWSQTWYWIIKWVHSVRLFAVSLFEMEIGVSNDSTGAIHLWRCVCFAEGFTLYVQKADFIAVNLMGNTVKNVLDVSYSNTPGWINGF